MTRVVDEHRDQFGVEAICRTLGATECGFMTSRGYRAAKTRPPSARALRDVLLLEEVKQIHAENYSVYGVRKLHHAMRRAGWEVGRDQVARLMRTAGLQGVRRGRKPITTRSPGVPDHRPDLVERRFVADRPPPAVGRGHHPRADDHWVLLRRVHHRCLLPKDRRLGGVRQPAHGRVVAAGRGARAVEHGSQPRPPGLGPLLRPGLAGRIQLVVATP